MLQISLGSKTTTTMVTFSLQTFEHLLQESLKQRPSSFASCSEFVCLCVEEPFFLEKGEEENTIVRNEREATN
jgi:hypothetical protein